MTKPTMSEIAPETLDRIRELRQAEAEAFANYVEARDAFNKALKELRNEYATNLLDEQRGR